MSLIIHVTPQKNISGDISVSGDKSISHRAIMLASIADGVTDISNLLLSADVLATINIMRELGVVIEKIPPTPLLQRGEKTSALLQEEEKMNILLQGGEKTNALLQRNEIVRVHGVGSHGLQPPKNPLNCGNSGTTMRLLCGLLSAQKFNSVLVGDESLMKRPMARIAEPLRLMGAKINLSENNTAPIEIIGGQKLKAIDYELMIPSAQVKSGILLASLYAEGETHVREKIPTRDHTERMLKNPQRFSITVPGDISSAAFFIVLAAITKGADLIIREVGVNPFRTGIIDILKLMGANIEIFNKTFFGNEPVADIRIKYAPLHGIVIPEKCVSSAIDEFPAIFIAAVTAKGKTILHGAKELRVKESDRIAMMSKNLKILNIKVEECDDGILIEGEQTFSGGEVDSFGDHRIAMAFAIAGNIATAPIIVHDCENIATSFPVFFTLGKSLGMQLRLK